MKTYQILIVTILATFVCFLEGQQTTRKYDSKFNKAFSELSQECFKENRVTPERVVAVYAINTNDRNAKCYVACMLTKFNMTDVNGNYNDKALEKMMFRSNYREIPNGVRSVIEKCEKEDDKDHCEKAVKFTKCINEHKHELKILNNTSTTSTTRRQTETQFNMGRRPWMRT